MRFNLSFAALPQLIWAVVISILVSCNKDDQSPTRCEIQSFRNAHNQVVSFVYQEDFAQLTRVNLLDTNSKLATNNYALVTYNDKKQISKLTYYTFIGLLSDSIITFNYNEDGSLRRKNKYARRTLIDSVLVRYEELLYESNQVTEKLTFRTGKTSPSPESYQLHTYAYDALKNVKQEIFYPVSDVTRTTTKSTPVTTTYLYDSKPNPLQKTYFFTEITPTQFSQNNVVEATIPLTPDSTKVINSTYVYNNMGYLYGATITTISKVNAKKDSTLTSTKRSFTYICK